MSYYGPYRAYRQVPPKRRGWGSGVHWDVNPAWPSHQFNPGVEVVRVSTSLRGVVLDRDRLHATVKWWDGTTTEIDQFDPDVVRYV